LGLKAEAALGLLIGADTDISECNSHGEILLWWSVRIRRCANSARKEWTQAPSQNGAMFSSRRRDGSKCDRAFRER
jgi:hypothetical protein